MILIHVIGVCWIAYGGNITFQHVIDCLASIPRSPLTSGDITWYSSFLHQILVLASNNCRTPEDVRRVNAAHDYLTKETPAAGSKAIAATVQHIAAIIANFLQGELYDTTCCDESEPIIEAILNGGIVICDDPVLLGQRFQFVQLLVGLILTRETLAREVNNDTPLVCMVADEYHRLSCPDIDLEACTLGRSQKLSRITAIQSIGVLMTAMNEGVKAKATVDSLIGNHNTLLFLRNNDPDTCKFFEELSGKIRRYDSGGNRQGQGRTPNQGVDPFGTGQFNVSFHSSMQPRFYGSALHTLKNGGEENNITVSGYVFQETLNKFEFKQQ